MRRVVFDIETVGQDFSSLDDISRDYFLRFADTPKKAEEARMGVHCSPLTAQIVAIGMMEVETGRGAVYYQNNRGLPEKSREGEVLFLSGGEREILAHFWRQLKRYDQFITFNGRSFDGPFIMTRSAIQGIRATKNLVPYRYNHNLHVDLIDQLSFYDATRRRFGLHMWCKAFGIASPKEGGISGLQIPELFRAGRFLDIARYCLDDVIATKALFNYWDKYMKF